MTAVDNFCTGLARASTVKGVRSRLASALAAALLVGVLTVGCTPTPEPSPTPTGFTTEEEAFAAAEETYRAYVDALNARREDRTSRPSPDSFLIGAALEAALDAERQFDAAGVAIEGDSRIDSLTPARASDDLEEVTVVVCLDSSSTQVIDREGNDITPTDRPAKAPLSVTLQLVTGQYLIEQSVTTEATECSA